MFIVADLVSLSNIAEIIHLAKTLSFHFLEEMTAKRKNDNNNYN